MVGVALDDDLGVGRHFERDRLARNRLDPPAVEKPREDEFADVRRKRARGGVGEGRFAAEHDRHGHRLAAFAPLAKDAGAVVVDVPVCGGQLRAENLDAVHADVGNTGIGILGIDARRA